MRIIPVNCINHETTLAKTIHNANGNILLRKGTTLTPSLLDKIKAAGIHTLYIDDGYSNIEIEDVIKPELRRTAVKTIKETFQAIEHELDRKINENTPLFKRLEVKVMDKYLHKIKGVSDAIIEDILKSHNLLINIIDIKHLGEFAYEHAINVAVLSLIIGIELRFTQHELYCLFIGALLHDIGKVFLPDHLLDYNIHMSREERLIYEEHPILGYDYLKDNKGFSATSKIVILQHHEHVDGTGFPNKVYGNNIHKNAKIVAVCDAYDKMVSDTHDSPAVPANEAIEFIMGSAQTQFDFKIVNTFVHKINPYPIGTLVELSNHKTAVVIDINVDFPLRPIVKVVKKIQGQVIRLETINLIERNDLTISKIRFVDVDNENK